MRHCAWILLLFLCSCASTQVYHLEHQRNAELEVLDQALANPRSVPLEKRRLLFQSHQAKVDPSGFSEGGLPKDDPWILDRLHSVGETESAKLLEADGRGARKPSFRGPMVTGGAVIGVIAGIASSVGIYQSSSRGLGDIGLIVLVPLVISVEAALGAGLGYLASLGSYHSKKTADDGAWRQKAADTYNRALEKRLLADPGPAQAPVSGP